PQNLTNDSGDTLLMLAAYHGHADTVRALLTRGADPNRLNDRGQSPWRERCSRTNRTSCERCCPVAPTRRQGIPRRSTRQVCSVTKTCSPCFVVERSAPGMRRSSHCDRPAVGGR